MRKIRAGDRAAFDALYGRYAPRALGLARQVLGDGDRAEDVVQNVFLDVWRQADRYDPARSAVGSWVMTLTHHKAVDAVRREDRHRRRRSPAEHLDTAVDPGPAPDASAVDADQRLVVRRALRRLEPLQRQTIVLAYFGGYTYREIANILEIPEGTAKSRGRCGLRKLTALLAEAA